MQFLPDLADWREYKQALAQVNFYSDQSNARHVFIPSNSELVAVKPLALDLRLKYIALDIFIVKLPLNCLCQVFFGSNFSLNI